MQTRPHIPVLADDVVRILGPGPGRRFIDGTLGAGGHTGLLLDAGADEVLGIDRDPAAHAAARAHLGPLYPRVRAEHGTFGDIKAIAERTGFVGVNGILVDIGLSSMQLDTPERGFAFSKAGPLDMRMDPTQGESALEMVRRLPPEKLAEIIRDYGEERFAVRIAGAIKDAVRGHAPTTTELAERIASVIPAKAKRHQRIHPATRTFQALRIAVNQELDELDRFLRDFIDLLAPLGRCVVISFHSLEDRKVKRRFRELAWSSSLPPDLARQAGERVHPIVRIVTRKAITADDAEVAANPRARSAKLRACEKCEVQD